MKENETGDILTVSVRISPVFPFCGPFPHPLRQLCHVPQDPAGLRLAGFQVRLRALAGEDQDAVDAGVDGAGDVGVEPVPHQDRLLRGEACALHGQERHLRLGLADDPGPPPGGPIEHLADAAAVRHAAIPGGADPVGIGGQELRSPVQKDAGVLQLLKGQFRVKAADEDLRLVPVGGHGKPRAPQLAAEGLRPGDVEGFPLVVPLPQEEDQGVHGGQKVLRHALDPQAAELFHVAVRPPGGVVGEEEVASALLPDAPEEGDGAGEEVVVQVQCAVHIQQEEPLFGKSQLPERPSRPGSAVSQP